MKPHATTEREEWVIWNGLLGALDTVLIGSVEVGPDGSRRAHLRSPYEMVGPFSLDELETRHFIDFAACTVMSRRRWREEQAELRRDARERRRKFAARMRAEHARVGEEYEGYRRDFWRGEGGLSPLEQRQYRARLGVPLEGVLSPSAINSAFRRRAKAAHPDTGGSQEEFVRLTEARDALLGASS